MLQRPKPAAVARAAARAGAGARVASAVAGGGDIVRCWLLAVCVLAWSGAAFGKGPAPFTEGVTSDAQQIQAVLASIPVTDRSMGYANLGERLSNLGMKVERIDAGRFSADELKAGRGLKRGDVDFRFYGTGPSDVVRAICPISGVFSFVKRGKQWLPEDRSANWLMNGMAHCRAP